MWSCLACKARFVHPLPSRQELRERYRVEHERGKWSECFSTQLTGELTRRAALLRRLLDGQSARLLDVGCGDGRFLVAAATAGFAGVGLEIDVAAVADSRAGAEFVGSLDAVAGRPLFDAITFWDVLEHVPDPADQLAAATARLRPGGLIAATMPNVLGTASRFLGGQWPYYDFETFGHLFHLSPGHVATLMSNAGLVPIYSETRGSVDLRTVPFERWGRRVPRGALWVLDRLSGLLARVAQPIGQGNTLLVVGRKPE